MTVSLKLKTRGSVSVRVVGNVKKYVNSVGAY